MDPPSPRPDRPASRIFLPEVRQVQSIDPDRTVEVGPERIGRPIGSFGTEDTNLVAAIGEETANVTDVDRCTPSVIRGVDFRDVPDPKPRAGILLLIHRLGDSACLGTSRVVNAFFIISPSVQGLMARSG